MSRKLAPPTVPLQIALGPLIPEVPPPVQIACKESQEKLSHPAQHLKRALRGSTAIAEGLKRPTTPQPGAAVVVSGGIVSKARDT